jgi:MerR HTH family regulatory protein
MRSSDPTFHTVGAVARRYGCRPWQVRRLFERGLLPPAPRVGAYRVFSAADLPRIEQALRRAGYIPQGSEVADGVDGTFLPPERAATAPPEAMPRFPCEHLLEETGQ